MKQATGKIEISFSCPHKDTPEMGIDEARGMLLELLSTPGAISIKEVSREDGSHLHSEVSISAAISGEVR